MTPEEAQALEPGTTSGPWHSLHEEWEDEDGTPCEQFNVIAGGDAILETIDFDPANHNPRANTALAAAAPDMRATIAAMTYEYRAQYWEAVWDRWVTLCDWTDEDAASDRLKPDALHGVRTRLVRRLVGDAEVVDASCAMRSERIRP